MSPDVPPAFVWRDEASGAEVLALWHPLGYGGTGLKDAVLLPNGHALVTDWNGDNAGPRSAEQIRTTWRGLKKLFPAAKIQASTFDNFVDAMDAVRSTLLVVTADIDDTWIYGAPSDPGKVTESTRACSYYSN